MASDVSACGMSPARPLAGASRAGKSGSRVRPFRSSCLQACRTLSRLAASFFSLSVRLLRSSLIAFLSVPAPCPMGRASSVSGLGPAAVAGAGSRGLIDAVHRRGSFPTVAELLPGGVACRYRRMPAWHSSGIYAATLRPRLTPPRPDACPWLWPSRLALHGFRAAPCKPCCHCQRV